MVQRRVARHDRAHQHVCPSAGIFGQGLHAHVGPQLESVERNARPPGVIQRRQNRARVGLAVGRALLVGLRDHRHQCREVRELQCDRPRCLQPHQAGGIAQLGGQVGRVHRVVVAGGDTPGFQFGLGKRFVGAVGVVRHQHFVILAQERHVHQRHRRQSTGHQHAVLATFERGNAFFQCERGGGAVQAVGVA